MIVIVNNGQRALPTEDVAHIIGAATNASAIAALKAVNIAPAAKQPYGRGHRYFWPEDRVLQRADRLRASVARNMRHSHGAPTAPVAAVSKLPDDDSLDAIRKTLDGLKPYVCRLGEEQARARTDADQHSAQLRVLTIGINRLLKAAGLQAVPEAPGGSGEAQ